MATQDPFEMIKILANVVDRLAGEVAGLSAITAHLPGVASLDVDKVRAASVSYAPQHVQVGGRIVLSDPPSISQETVRKIISRATEIEAELHK